MGAREAEQAQPPPITLIDVLEESANTEEQLDSDPKH